MLWRTYRDFGWGIGVTDEEIVLKHDSKPIFNIQIFAEDINLIFAECVVFLQFTKLFLSRLEIIR